MTRSEVLKEIRAIYVDAAYAITLGQEYSIDGQKLNRDDLPMIHSIISDLTAEIGGRTIPERLPARWLY